MLKDETNKLIDEIKFNANGCNWNFIKTMGTTSDFRNYLINFNHEESIEYFGVHSIDNSVIEEVIMWTKTQLDNTGTLNYSHHNLNNFIPKTQNASEYWLIFFKNRDN